MHSSAKPGKVTVTLKGGDLTLKCPHGNPYTRSTVSGMCCDAKPCHCEQANEESVSQLVGMLGPSFSGVFGGLMGVKK